MATSGYARTNTAFGYVELSWAESSQDVANNKTTISYALKIYRSSNINSSASKSYSIVINGSTVASGTTTIGGSGTKTIKTGTTTISHNSDGKKSFAYSFSQQINITWSGNWIGTVTGSNTGTLDDIPRTSKPTVNDSTIDYGTAVTISTNRASTAFTHTLRYSVSGQSGTIATGVSTSYAWTVPTSLMNYLTDRTSTSCTIYCDTYNGGSKIGTESVAITLYVPISVMPSFTSLSASEDNSVVSSKSLGFFVQDLSKIRFHINGASGAYGSTITKYEVTFAGKTYTGSAHMTTDTIKSSGTVRATAKITDSRGRSATKTYDANITPYSPPNLTNFDVVRANSDGTLNDLGTTAKITRTGTVSDLNGRNYYGYKVYAKSRGASTWVERAGATGGAGYNSMNSTHTVSGTYDVTSSYDFRLDFYDMFNTTVSLDVLATGEVAMSWAPSGIGVGKVHEKGALDVGGDAHFEAGNYPKLPDTPDINAWDGIQNGMKYAVVSGGGYPESYGTLFSIADSEHRNFQLFHGKNTDNLYIRTYVSGVGWTGFNQLVTADNSPRMTFPANQYATDGVAPINMSNSDIIKVNNVYMSDAATSSAEGIQWARNSTDTSNYDSAGWDSFRVYEGRMYLNDRPLNPKVDNANVLWSGAYHMGDTQTVTPSRKLTDCANGWVIAWSDYDNSTGAINDTDMHLTYVHKHHIMAFNGKWMPMMIPSYKFNWVVKYIGLYDDKMTGHSHNNSSDTSYNAGDPRDVIIRKVYEW